MDTSLIAARVQFAFTVMFHYLFPVLTMGLGVLIAVLKTLEFAGKGREYGEAARFWARIFAISFAAGVVTGIPMEFQFGTNWARFSKFAGPVVGQTLFMEGVFAFFAQSSFIGVFLFGESRVRPVLHWLSAVMVGAGSILSGFFFVATDAWMQHPVGYQIVNGRAELTSLWALLNNPYAWWQYPHVVVGSLVTASTVMAGIGAYNLLSKRDEAHSRLFVRVGVISGVLSAMLALFPTGTYQARNVATRQPVKQAAMEGVFTTQPDAPVAIIGMPDSERGQLLDPIVVPGLLSYLAYGSTNASVLGLNAIPPEDRPPVELVYYAYHIMVGLGTVFIAVFLVAGFALWRGWIYDSRLVLWTLMLAMPFPYIANEAGWMTAEIGRQPWIVYGLLRTTVATSTNVSGGMTIFTLFGFMGLYLLVGLLYLVLFLRIVNAGPGAANHTEARA
jgi:cytochrome d ubiquinol oxidase subunit I